MKQWALPGLLVLLIGTLAMASDAESRRGLWPMPNHNVGNTRRADLPGAMTAAPREVWHLGHRQHAPSYVRALNIGARACLLTVENGRLQMVDLAAGVLWHRPFGGPSTVMGVLEGPTGPRILAKSGYDCVLLLDAATGQEQWRWLLPQGTGLTFGWKLTAAEQPSAGSGSVQGLAVRLYAFPTGMQHGDLGFCFEFLPDRGEPRQVWQASYASLYTANFGPLIALADMDRDGRDEIVLAGKPTTIIVIDGDTGQVKCKARYAVEGASGDIGRPYGLLAVEDVDGDGYPDVVMASTAVEDYLAVLKNVNGSSLELAWSTFIEQDFPDNRRQLVPAMTSLADVNGDGLKELVLGTFNLDEDQRWHTIAFPPMKGLTARLIDLPDRYFHGCWDLNGDGRPEIVVSQQTAREIAPPSLVEAVDGVTGHAMASVPQATITSGSLPANGEQFPKHATYYGNLSQFVVVQRPGGGLAMLLARSEQDDEVLWSIREGGNHFEPFEATRLSRLIIEGCPPGLPLPASLSIPDAPTTGQSAGSPLVAWRSGQPELIMVRGDSTIVGGRVDLSTPNTLGDAWCVEGTNPSVWQGPSGQCVVTAASADRRAVLLWADPAQDAAPTRIELPAAMTAGYAQVPLDLDGQLTLMVPMQRALHAQACGLYDAAGRPIWLDMTHGPYPQQAGAGDLNGDGNPEIVVDDHGWQAVYDTGGKPKVFAQAWHTTVPGRGDGSAYALPIIGPFGPDGQVRIIMASALMALEVLGSDGQRLSKLDLRSDAYMFERCRAAIARCRPGTWSIGLISKDGRFHCADAATASIRWTLPLDCPIFETVLISSGDVNGDGLDEFVFGLADGSVWAVGEGSDGQGRIVWKMKLDHGVRDCILADVDGDGKVELIVGTADGLVHVLR